MKRPLKTSFRIGLGALALVSFSPQVHAATAPQATLALAPAVPAAQSDDDLGKEALASFQARHKAVLQLIADKASAEAVQKEVDLVLDYVDLAHAALGGSDHYAAQCKTRCAEFDAALTRLIRENYLRMIRQAKADQVEYSGVAVSPKTKAVKITTKIKTQQSGRKSVEVAYVVQRKDGRWLIADIITEGVSLRKTYRYEFGKILEKPGDAGGIDAVIRKIDDKLKEIAKPEAKATADSAEGTAPASKAATPATKSGGH
jgi:phospholipid transport system substrate-binding protein